MKSNHKRALAGMLYLCLLLTLLPPAAAETAENNSALGTAPTEETAGDSSPVPETGPGDTPEPSLTPEPGMTPEMTDGIPAGIPLQGASPETALTLKEGRTAQGDITEETPVLYYVLSIPESGDYTFISGGSLAVTARLLDDGNRLMASFAPDNQNTSSSGSKHFTQMVSLIKGTGYLLAVQSAVTGKAGQFTVRFSREDAKTTSPAPETKVEPESTAEGLQETIPAPAETLSVTEQPQETIPMTASPAEAADAPPDETPAAQEPEAAAGQGQEAAQMTAAPVDATEVPQDAMPAASETLSATELPQVTATAVIIQDDDSEATEEAAPATAEPEPTAEQPQETEPAASTPDKAEQPPQEASPAPPEPESTTVPPLDTTPVPEALDAASPSPIPAPAAVLEIGNEPNPTASLPFQTVLPMPVGVLRSQGAAGWPMPPVSKGINLYPESTHPYANGVTVDYYYEEPDAAGYAVTFHRDTFVEAGFDFLYLLDKDKNPLTFTDEESNVWERFTGDQADNVTLIISSPTFYTRLAANASGSGYGFRYASILPIYPVSADTCIVYTCEQTGAFTVRIVWNEVAGTDGYTLYRSSGGAFMALKSVTGTSTVNLSLTPGQTYTYKVRPYTLSGLTRVYGTYSNEKSVQLLAIPQFVKAAAVDASTAYLDWADVEQADGYNLYRATQPAGAYAYVKSVTGSYALDSGMAGGVTYYYKVTPWRVYSTKVYGAQSAATASIRYVAPVLTLVRQSGAQTARIEWTAQAGATGYTLYRSTSADGTYLGMKSVPGIYTYNYNLTPGQEYYYKVRAYTDVNGSRWYGSYTDSLGVRMLAAPAITGISASGTTASIQWSAVMDAAGYVLFRSEDISGPFLAMKSVTGLSTSNYNLVPGKTYYYAVCAFRMYGTLKVKGALGAPTGVRVPSDITYRALVIGQSDYLYLMPLHGASDAANVASMLANLSMDGETYQTTIATNLTAGQMLSAIPGAFAGADENDVSLFFYSGHGNSSTGVLAGSLYGTDSGTVTPTQLKSALDAVPGTVIVLIDSCGSGTYIYDDLTKAAGGPATKADAYAFTSAIISTFSGPVSRYGELLEGKYKVLTASEYGEYSYETSLGGMFTNAMCEAGGWDPVGRARINLLGDSNADSIVTLQEGYTYIYNNTDLAYQVVQVYPYGSSYPLFSR